MAQHSAIKMLASRVGRLIICQACACHGVLTFRWGWSWNMWELWKRENFLTTMKSWDRSVWQWNNSCLKYNLENAFDRFEHFPTACLCLSLAGSDQSSTHRFTTLFSLLVLKVSTIQLYLQCNDVALMALLGSVMKSANNLNQFVNKFNTVVLAATVMITHS